MCEFTQLLKFKSYSSVAPVVAYSGDMVACVAEDNHKIALYRGECGLSPPDGHENNITCMDFMSDSSCLVTGSQDGTVKVWDTDDCICQDTVLFRKPVMRLACNPRYKMVAVELDSSHVKLRHLNDKFTDVIDIQIQDDSHVTALIQSEEQIIYGTNQGTVYVWNYEEENCPVLMLRGHKTPIKHLSICDTNLLSLAENDTIMRVWDLRTGQQVHKISLKKTHPCQGILLTGIDRVFLTSARFAFIFSCKTQSVIREVDVKADVASMRSNEDSLLMVTWDGSLLHMPLTDVIQTGNDVDRNAQNDLEIDENKDGEAKRRASSACNIL